MNKDNMTITSKQLIFIFIGSMVATGILSLPRVASTDAREDAWIAVLLGTLVPILSLYLIERLGRKSPDVNLVEIARLLFGKIAGPFMILIFIAYAIWLQSIVVRMFAEITSLYLLPTTPLPVIILVIILAVIYIVNKGARTIARINELLFYLSLTLLFLMIIAMSGGIDITNILPVGKAGLKGIARGTLTTAYSYAGIEVLLVYYFLVTRKDEVIKAGLTAIGITSFIYVNVVIICILILGVETLQKIMFPVLVLLKAVQVSVVERLEFFFLLVWLAVGPRPTINMGFAAAYTLGHLLKINMQRYFHLVVIAIGTGTYILALIPGDIYILFKWADYEGIFFLIMSIIYPLIFLIALWIRRKQVNNFE